MHRIRPLLSLPIALLLATACTPNDADVQGTYTAWLAAGSSATVSEGELDLANAASVLDCREDPIGAANVDCTSFAPTWATWLADDAYYIFKDKIETWRSEAIITSEGDFQLTFHIDIGNGEDFRVAFAIDPDFQPMECAQDLTTGETSLEQVDNADWIEQWSVDEDGMFIYYLNAGAYQYNPSNSDDYWIFPLEWSAGFSASKFAVEDFYSDPPAYGFFATGFENWYATDTASWQNLLTKVQNYQTTWAQELIEQGQADSTFNLKLEDNAWRTIDSSAAGLDGWIELSSSWIRIDKRDIEVGSAVKGDFQIYMYSAESGSMLLITGTFDVPEIKEDKWGYPVLEDDKRKENNTPTCE